MSKGDWKRPRSSDVSKEQYDKNFEAAFGKTKLKTWKPVEDYNPFWEPAPRSDGRMEWSCPHGVGHGNHIHGCDGCCSREDYPGRKEVYYEQEESVQDSPTSKGGSRREASSPTPRTESPDREGSRHSGGEAQEFSDSGSPQ